MVPASSGLQEVDDLLGNPRHDLFALHTMLENYNFSELDLPLGATLDGDQLRWDGLIAIDCTRRFVTLRACAAVLYWGAPK
jgi:hypothetical protein